MTHRPLGILLAEDDDGHAYLIEENLRDAGLSNPVVRVADGQDALDYVRRSGPFSDREAAGPLLVLLDINLPRVHGVEVLRQLKADPATADLPVVVLTTTDDPREVRQCYELGCSSYVAKPVGRDQFVEAIRRVGLFLAVVKLPREGS